MTSKGITNWEKLKLLLWKNWILQWSQKIQLLFALLLPTLYLLLLVLLRAVVLPEEMPETHYKPVSITNLSLFAKSIMTGNRILHENGTLNIPKLMLAYTPPNDINAKIMLGAILKLTLFGYHAFPNASAMEEAMMEHNYIAGVQFDTSTENQKTFPTNFSYSLRFPSELRTATGPLIETWRTSNAFPPYDMSGPRNYNVSDGGVPVGYIMEGFIPIQHALFMSYLEQASSAEKLPYVEMQRFPYPAYILDPLLSGLQQLMPLIMLLSYIYPCTYIAKYITHEKEKQLKEIMKIMGLHNWLHWTAWFVKSFLLLTVVTLLIVILLKFQFYGNVSVLTYSNFLVLFTFLLFYVTASICFCFMCAVFFSKASTAAAVTGILWFLSYVPYSFAFYYYDRLSLCQKLFGCLLSNTALGFGFKVIMAFEGSGDGMTWSNIFEPVSDDDSLALIHVMGMLLLAAFIYMIICLYVEQVFPGEYGVPRKWHFPFHSEFWQNCKCCKKQASTYDDSLDDFSGKENRVRLQRGRPLAGQSQINYESDESSVAASNQEIGLRLINLKKKYDERYAVKGLTLDMFVNEITVLLGHNGAGKTTTILMLTGIIPPTEGTAIVNGCDIRIDLECARQSLGICPQHNVLFEDMSVRNHIIFFSCLKGIRGSAAIEDEVDKYIAIMELEDKEDVRASKLSGGMKRKLSLCCALCGNTKTVLCDEPSSGVDPAARRRLWDLLQAEKMGRTVLLTTHHMDEADVLGDRIAIMCDGQLQCYGTSFSLKKLYGSGYRLICVKREGCVEADVTALLRKYILNISPESEIGTELTYRLPTEFTNMYAEILAALEDKSEDLKLAGFGLSIATLEEVFMRVGAEYTSDNQQRSFTSILHGTEDSRQNDVLFDGKTREPSRCRRNLHKWAAMFLKKLLITYRNWKIFFLQMLLPIVFMLITILNSRGGRIYYTLQPLPIELTMFSETVTVLEVTRYVKINSDEAKIADEYEKYVKSFGPSHQFVYTNFRPFEEYILTMSKTRNSKVSSTYVAGATITPGKLTAWLNNKPLHTAPLTLNILHNAMARVYLGPKAEVHVVNDPLPYSNDTLILRLNKGSRLGTEIAVNLCLCMCFATAFYALPLIKEQEKRSKLLQFVSGVNVCAYWFSQYVWDYLTFILMAFLAILTIACFHERGYTTPTDLSRYLVVILVFGLAVLPLTYVLSLCFTDSATGFTRIAIFNLLTGVGFFSIHIALSFEPFQTKYIANELLWYFRVFPHFSLATGMHRLNINHNIRRGCKIPYITKIPETMRCQIVPLCCAIPDYYDWKTPGVMPELAYLLITALVLSIYLIVSESRLKAWLGKLYMRIKEKYGRSKGGAETKDEEVIAEAERVNKLSREERIELPLVLDRVSKIYGRHVAVNQISLCVSRGECFGLLGVNGAGKTSTFKMLTGDEKISSGNAYVKGYSLRTQMHKIYSQIGYCPQFDALFEELTGRETMRIYCLLRGVKCRYIRMISEELAQAFGFMKHIDKPIQHYSGGNKRKLSAALALIGNPTVMYLDEPTSGMDPAARRQLWNMVCHIRDVGKSIVLTTHSMEECEALCTRLAIMVNGEFKCMGSTQHLKNKFSKGLVLKIKVLKGTNEFPVELKKVVSDKVWKIEEISDDQTKNGLDENERKDDAKLKQVSEENEPMHADKYVKMEEGRTGKESNDHNKEELGENYDKEKGINENGKREEVEADPVNNEPNKRESNENEEKVQRAEESINENPNETKSIENEKQVENVKMVDDDIPGTSAQAREAHANLSKRSHPSQKSVPLDKREVDEEWRMVDGEESQQVTKDEIEQKVQLTSTHHLLKVKQFIAMNIPEAQFQEEYQGLLTFYIPLYSIKWSQIFNLIESNRETLFIEDYSISQTTLEEIFLEFARDRHRVRRTSFLIR